MRTNRFRQVYFDKDKNCYCMPSVSLNGFNSMTELVYSFPPGEKVLKFHSLKIAEVDWSGKKKDRIQTIVYVPKEKDGDCFIEIDEIALPIELKKLSLEEIAKFDLEIALLLFFVVKTA